MRKFYQIIASAVLAISVNHSFGQTIWSEDFSTATGNTPPSGWLNDDVTSSGLLWSFDNPGGRTINSPLTDPVAIIDSDDLCSEAEETDLVTPVIDLSSYSGSIFLEFDHFFRSGWGGAYSVEVYNGSTWNVVLSGGATSTTDPQSESIDITTASGLSAATRIKFKWTGECSWYWILDNLEVKSVSCATPTAVNAPAMTSNSIDVSWTAGGTETDWNIEWGAAGFTPGTGTEIGSDALTSNSYSIPSLSSNTIYDIYVQADCDANGVSSWSNVLQLTTTADCGDTVTGLCYSMNSAQEVLLNFTATAGDWAELVFLAGGVEACCDEVIVYDGLNGTGNIIYGALTGGGLADYSAEGSVVSSTGMLSLVVNADGSSTCSSDGYTPFEIALNCLVPPTCLEPSALTVVTVETTTADISWTAGGSETDWNIEWGATGFTPGTGTEIGSDVSTVASYTINGLTENTTYDIYVQADCGGGDLSTWNGPITISTECEAIAALNFCEDFEDIAALSCWRVIDKNEDDERWAVYTGYSNSGDQSAGLYTDGHGGDNDDYLVLPKMTLTGNEVMTFHYRARSSNEPNDYRVVLSTTGYNPTDFTTELFADTISNTTYQDTSINLSAHTGDVFIAFYVPSGGLDGWYVFIDDVCIDMCTPNPGTDGSVDICRLDGTVDLNTVITSDYTHGVWNFAANPGVLNGSTLNVSTLANGTYTIEYVVTTGCTADTTIATINVVSPSSAGNNGLLNVCKNQLIDLYGGLSGNVDFGGTWYTPDGTPMTSSYFQTGTLQGQFVYEYVVSNGVCDPDTSEVTINIGSCDFLGLEDVTLLENVSIAPNPNQGTFQIIGIPGADYTYEVLDLNGRVVRTTQKITSTITNVNLTDVENGVYMIRIAGNNSERMIRVIKQH